MQHFNVTIRGREIDEAFRQVETVVEKRLSSIGADGSDYETLVVGVLANSEAQAESRLAKKLPHGCWVEHVEEGSA